ncbi:hypothetical protein ACFQGA_03705 [Marinobacter koreensis]|uniref:hypothetical protein n=1 Tax=Marinobacter koreensis TaxID=335974 RepID=UPI00361CD3A0
MWRKALLVGRWLLPYIRGAAPIILMLAVIALLVATWWLAPVGRSMEDIHLRLGRCGLW